MSAPLTIPAHCNGPPESGNGGYSAGALASLLDGPVEVSLRRPVPLGRPLQTVVDDGSAQLLDGEALVADAERAPDFEIEVPGPVSPADARAAMSRYRGRTDGPFSRCFVCGRARQDAIGVFAGPLEGRSLVASVWAPDPSTASAGGRVRPELVWAVLDCPTYFAAYRDEESTVSFLARLIARLDAPVMTGEEHVVIAWPLEVDGRKRRAGSAILTAGGEVRARAEALLIEPRPG